MRRRVAWATALLIVLLVALPQQGAALPTVRGAVTGFGTAESFTIFGKGLPALEGGAMEWNLVCSDCFFRIAITDSSYTLVQDGTAGVLAPGSYEVREYRGLISHSQEPDGFLVILTGAGHFIPI